MKTSTPCTCHTETDACALGLLERPRYFPRQLLTPAELTLEQQYFRDKLRRHNRLLHGWGVVCGAEVCRVPPEEASRYDQRKAAAAGTTLPPQQPVRPQPWKVRVKPGYILGPYGDEIVIACERIVDLRTHGLTGECGEQGEAVDPWCAPVWVQRGDGPLWIAVRYKELPSRPVRVQPAGCGCDETQCEYSRWRDGYEICILELDDCPPSHQNPPSFEDPFQGPIPACPDCPDEPWVILARVELDGDGAVTVLDNCSCRRMAVGFASYWWQCQGDACDILRLEGDRTVEDDRDFTIEVEVLDQPAGLSRDHVSFGDAVEVREVTPLEGRRIRITGHVKKDAAPGPLTLTIRHPETNRVLAARREAVFVHPRAAAGQPTAPAPAPPSPAEPAPAPDAPQPESVKPKPSRPRKKEEEK